jgi:hypothetical protein
LAPQSPLRLPCKIGGLENSSTNFERKIKFTFVFSTLTVKPDVLEVCGGSDLVLGTISFDLKKQFVENKSGNQQGSYDRLNHFLSLQGKQ